MRAAAGSTPKERLLGAVLEHAAVNGIQDTTLRGLAAAVGTSHRLLNYHFGSRRGLLVEVSRAVERQQRILPEVVDAWIGPVADLFARLGFAADEARAEARLSLAVTRGLLLDLLGTGDRAAVDAAAERYVARYVYSSSGGRALGPSG